MTVKITMNDSTDPLLINQVVYEYTRRNDSLSIVCMAYLPLMVEGKSSSKLIAVGVATAPSLAEYDEQKLIQSAFVQCEDSARYQLVLLNDHIAHMAMSHPALLSDGNTTFAELKWMRNLLFYLLSSQADYQPAMWKSLANEEGIANDDYFYAGFDFTVNGEFITLVINPPLVEYGYFIAQELERAKPAYAETHKTLSFLEQYHVLTHLIPATRYH